MSGCHDPACCGIFLKANVSGHRADIYLIEAAKAIAALYNRMFIMPKDIEEAAEFVLPHRMRKPDTERNNTPQTEQNKEQEQEKRTSLKIMNSRLRRMRI